jgi:hypothetical protein
LRLLWTMKTWITIKTQYGEFAPRGFCVADFFWSKHGPCATYLHASALGQILSGALFGFLFGIIGFVLAGEATRSFWWILFVTGGSAIGTYVARATGATVEESASTRLCLLSHTHVHCLCCPLLLQPTMYVSGAWLQLALVPLLVRFCFMRSYLPAHSTRQLRRSGSPCGRTQPFHCQLPRAGPGHPSAWVVGSKPPLLSGAGLAAMSKLLLRLLPL